MEIPISKQEQEEADRFYEAMGRTLGQWAIVEHYVGALFWYVSGLPPERARSLFHSARSWRGKYDMLSCIISGGGGGLGVEKCRSTLLAKANSYADFRNHIAHHAVRLTPFQPGKLRSLVILPPASPLSGPTEAEIGRGEIEIAGENIKLLGALFSRAVTLSPSDQEGSPERVSWLADQLPNPPHSRRVDPSIEAQFSLGLPLAPFPR